MLRLTQGSEDLSKFITKFGKVILFGLKNDPGRFQDVMIQLFSDIIGRGVYIYIDDILIYEKYG